MSVDEALEKPALPVPIHGQVFYGLSRGASYAAVKSGDIKTLRLAEQATLADRAATSMGRAGSVHPANDNMLTDPGARFRRQNLVYQGMDIGQSLAGGMPLGMIAAQQGPQLLQGYLGEGGGVKALLSDVTEMATGFLRVAGPVAAGVGLVYGAYKILQGNSAAAALAVDDATKALAEQAAPLSTAEAMVTDLARVQNAYRTAVADTAATHLDATARIVAATKEEFSAKQALLGLELKRQEAALAVRNSELATTSLNLKRDVAGKVLTDLSPANNAGFMDAQGRRFVNLPDAITGIGKTEDVLARNPLSDKLTEQRANLTLMEQAVGKLRDAMKATFNGAPIDGFKNSVGGARDQMSGLRQETEQVAAALKGINATAMPTLTSREQVDKDFLDATKLRGLDARDLENLVTARSRAFDRITGQEKREDAARRAGYDVQGARTDLERTSLARSQASADWLVTHKRGPLSDPDYFRTINIAEEAEKARIAQERSNSAFSRGQGMDDQLRSARENLGLIGRTTAATAALNAENTMRAQIEREVALGRDPADAAKEIALLRDKAAAIGHLAAQTQGLQSLQQQSDALDYSRAQLANIDLLGAARDRANTLAKAEIDIAHMGIDAHGKLAQSLRDVAAAQIDVNTAMAKAEFVQDLRFENQQLGRSSRDQSIYGRLHGTPFENDPAAVGYMRDVADVQDRRSAFTGFWSDFRDTARQNGGHIWEALGESAQNAFGRYIDKQMDNTIESLANSIFKMPDIPDSMKSGPLGAVASALGLGGKPDGTMANPIYVALAGAGGLPGLLGSGPADKLTGSTLGQFASGGLADSSVARGDVAAMGWNFFKGKGYSDVATAAILGQASGESGFNPAARGDRVNGVPKAFGLFQWHGDRGGGEGLINAGARAQFQHLYDELQGPESAANRGLLSATTLREANRAAIGFERPRGWSAANPEGGDNFTGRFNASAQVLDRFHGSVGAAASATDAATAATKSLAGGADQLGKGLGNLGSSLGSIINGATGGKGWSPTNLFGLGLSNTGAGFNPTATGLTDMLGYTAPASSSGGGLLSMLFSGIGSLFGLADGGHVRGPGGPTDDLIPAMLSNGEYVVNARSAARHRGVLDMINSGADFLGFSRGGIADPFAVPSPEMGSEVVISFGRKAS